MPLELVMLLGFIVMNLAMLVLTTVVIGVTVYRRKSQSLDKHVASLVASHRRRIAINEFLGDAIEENDVTESV